MVKRAAFARALALDPKVLFLDEPTSDLDPLTASGIDAMIGKLNEGLGVTVVIVTHDLTTLFTLCDRVAVLVDGKVTVDSLDRLLQSRQPWIHAFLHGPRARGAMTARRQAMETDKRYFVEGLFIIGFAVAAAFFAVWLANSGQRDDVTYRIHFAEWVSGLSVGDAVKFRGVDVGKVESDGARSGQSATRAGRCPPAQGHAGQDRHQGEPEAQGRHRRRLRRARRRKPGATSLASSDAGGPDPGNRLPRRAASRRWRNSFPR